MVLRPRLDQYAMAVASTRGGEAVSSSIQHHHLSVMTSTVMQGRLGATITGSGDRTIVFGNGLGTSQHTWRYVVEAFATRARMIRFDNVCSPAAPKGEYREEAYGSIYGYVDDLVALLDEFDVRDTLFVGHSISGMIGMLAAIAAPERIARLMMINSTPRFLEDFDFQTGFPRHVIDALLSAAQQDFPLWASGFASTAIGAGASDAHRLEFTEVLSAIRPDIALRVFQTVFLGDFRVMLPRLQQPVTILHSPLDLSVPVASGEFLVQQLPHATLVPLVTVGHIPQLTSPQEVIAAISRVLDEWT